MPFLAHASPPRSLVSLVRAGAPLVFLAGCGGRTELLIGGFDSGFEHGFETSGFDSSSGRDSSDEPDAELCVHIVLSAYDQSCNEASDCIPVASGTVCSLCEVSCAQGGLINRSEEATYKLAIAPLPPLAPTEGCSCLGQICPLGDSLVQCVNHECRWCYDVDAKAPSESGPSDGGRCIDINPLRFDQTCSLTSDCIEISTGTICSGDCLCGGATISQAAEAQYDGLVNSIPTSALGCGCANPGVPTCVAGQCVMCGSGVANPPPGCPDAF